MPDRPEPPTAGTVSAADPLDRLAAAGPERVSGLDWPALETALDARGFARTPELLDSAECGALAGLFDRDHLFRTTIEMPRHGYGEGRYRYFAQPLPPAVEALRRAFWPRLLPTARRWAARLGLPVEWPDDFDAWIARCRAAGQTRPTPLLLAYGAGGHNRLHQDLYGDLWFPLQVALFLDRPGVDHAGGAFLVVEQSPRRQSRAEALTPVQGAAVIFASRWRPVEGHRGAYRAQLRHGVATVEPGPDGTARRRTLGLIFHDSR